MYLITLKKEGNVYYIGNKGGVNRYGRETKERLVLTSSILFAKRFKELREVLSLLNYYKSIGEANLVQVNEEAV